MHPEAELRFTAPLSAVVTAGMVLAAIGSGDAVPHEVGPWRYALVPLVGVWSAIAPLAPRLSLVAAPLTAIALFATVLPAFPMPFALAVPLLVAGLRGYVAWALATCAVLLVLTSAFRLLGEEGGIAVTDLLVDVLRDGALMLVLLLLGDSLRARRAARHEAELESQLRQGEQEARLAAQRLATARELHDVLAHTLTLVSIQGGVVAESLDEPERAREAVATLRRATAEALADLRGTIELLRGGGEQTVTAPAPDLRHLGHLVDGARASGLDVRVECTGDMADVRPSLSLAGFRVVQEALTNTLRHGDADRAWVRVSHDDGITRVRVTDDGRAPAPHADEHPAGFGLPGMRERVESLGGRLTHGPRSDEHGFEVEAVFPGRAP
ncbi:histidine kinase [Microvirga sp. 0TCS3.31]